MVASHYNRSFHSKNNEGSRLISKRNSHKADYEELRVQELFENYKTFTPKEQEVFLLLAQEKNTDEIA